MSSQFFYVQLKFTPKIETDRVPVTKQHEAVVEVPKDLVQRKQSQNTSANSREKVIVLELARSKCSSGHVPDRYGTSYRAL